jgi:hypothetical protein
MKLIQLFPSKRMLQGEDWGAGRMETDHDRAAWRLAANWEKNNERIPCLDTTFGRGLPHSRRWAKERQLASRSAGSILRLQKQ